jgi:hypothetical protein
VAATPRDRRLLRGPPRRAVDPCRERHGAAHAAAEPLAPRHARSGVGSGRALLAVPRLRARRIAPSRPRPAESPHERPVDAARPRPQPARVRGRARGRRLRVRARVAGEETARLRRAVRSRADRPRGVGSRQPRPALRRNPAGPPLRARHAGRGLRKHGLGAALVRGPCDGRPAGRRRREPAALGLPGGDAGVGAVARGVSRSAKAVSGARCLYDASRRRRRPLSRGRPPSRPGRSRRCRRTRTGRDASSRRRRPRGARRRERSRRARPRARWRCTGRPRRERR